MTILADYLRDNTGKTHRIYPDTYGGLIVSDEYFDDEWTAPAYTYYTTHADYQTLTDSAGTTWYMYLNNYAEIVISSTAPSNAGAWLEPVYETGKQTPTEATVGDETYLALTDSGGTGWYVYPNAHGELIVTTTAPT